MLQIIVITAFLLVAISAHPVKIPAVYEDVDDVNQSPDVIRIVRQPDRRNEPRVFNFKGAVQQDPQRLRYVQQQQVDSYMKAFREQQTVRKSKQRIIPEEGRINTSTGSPRVTESTTKKPDVKTNVPKTMERSKRVKHGYQVREPDQDTEPSSFREAKVFVDGLNSVPYNFVAPAPINPYGVHQVDPNLFQNYLDSFGKGYDVPYPMHNIHVPQTGYDVHPHALLQNNPGNTQLDALNLLIGKPANVQLQGLNSLLGDQLNHAPQVVQPAVKDHTPIKEEVNEIINPQPQPNIKQELQSAKLIEEDRYRSGNNAASHQYLEGSKKIYGSDDLQYAAQYAFGYKIRDFDTGNNFGHEEVRKGSDTKGHYHVSLPDGRIQNVDYWADDTGYHAKVTYINYAHH